MGNKIFDVAIVGAGCAGLSAAVYAARFGMKAIVLSKNKGGLITETHLVENWPGEKSISGMALAQKLLGHVENYGVPVEYEEVEAITKAKNLFLVKTTSSEYSTKAVILATGSAHRHLGIPGEEKFKNKGVSFCALCDAAFFKNKAVAVIGGSDSAAKEALLLSEHASKVYIIYRRDKLRAEPINLDRVRGNRKIEIICNTNLVEIAGEKVVSKAVLDKPFKGSKELALSGVFVAVGQVPQSKLAAGLGAKLNESGEIAVDAGMRTSVEGLFAAGDVTAFDFKQAIVSAAQGATAVFSAFGYLGKGRG
jgi:thioredoxin reductase (NADPH)